MPSETDWPEFRSLFDQVYPNSSFPSLNECGRTPGQGGLRRHLEHLKTLNIPQTAIIDDEVIGLLEFML